MNYQLAILNEAKRRGWKPPLSPDQMRTCALAVRSPREKVAAVLKSTESYAATSLGLRRVPLQIYNVRKSTCERNECGSFGTLSNGSGVCHRCGCNGKMLNSKWLDPNQKCPAGLWGPHEAEVNNAAQ